LSLGSGVLTSSLRRLTRPASALFRAGQPPYPASYAGPLAEEPAPGPGFLPPFGHRHSLLGSSCARWGIPPPSRSACRRGMTRRTPSGLSRSACDRYDRGGRPLNPGDSGALPASQQRPAGTRLPTAGPCSPACRIPPARVLMTRRHRGFTCVHPSGLSLACSPRTERGALGISLGFAPRDYSRRTPGREQSLRTGQGTT
jgi:hypothetical protein